MASLAEQFLIARSAYIMNHQASLTIDNLFGQETNEETNEDFQNQEAIYLLHLNISNYENLLAYVQDIKQKYDTLPHEVKQNNIFIKKFNNMLTILSTDVTQKMNDNFKLMTHLHTMHHSQS